MAGDASGGKHGTLEVIVCGLGYICDGGQIFRERVNLGRVN